MMSRKLNLMVLLGLAVLVVMVTVCYGAGVPQAISYRANLTDKNGAPLPNGKYKVTFRIYSSPTGGGPLWSEKWGDANAVPPSLPVTAVNGVASVMVGAVNPLPASLFANYPKTYLGVSIENDTEMLPRMQIASVGYSFAAGNGVPTRGIIMWSGAVDQIPEGWVLCDGNNGTPDLRDKFVLGAGGSLPVTGGTLTHQHGIVSNDLNHYHGVYGHTHNYSGTTSGTVATRKIDDGDDHNVTNDEHTHTYAGTSDGGTAHTTNYASQQGFNLNHNHGGTTTLGNTILPPYFALAFIMKL